MRVIVFTAALSLLACSESSVSGIEDPNVSLEETVSETTIIDPEQLRVVSESDVSFDWPFTVSSGTIRCRSGMLLTFESNDIEYALNGTASSRGYKKIDPIWRANPNIAGTKVSVGPMISLAKEEC